MDGVLVVNGDMLGWRLSVNCGCWSNDEERKGYAWKIGWDINLVTMVYSVS
jgi:hypothetical protein